MINSVRARLTLWYVLVFGLLLVGFSIPTYLFLSRSLNQRLDRSLGSAAHATAAEFQSEIKEFDGDASSAAVEALIELRMPGIYTAIFGDDRVLASTLPEDEQNAFQGILAYAVAADGEMSFRTIDGLGKEGARAGVLPVEDGGNRYLVAVAEPLSELLEEVEAVRRIFYIGLPVTLLIAGIGGFLLAKKSLSPVLQMSEQAQRISATNLQKRLSISNPKDELGRLASVFNELLSRLDRSFMNMREFMADASHELRTPLSIIRGEADVALSQQRDPADYRESLTTIQDEARRLSRIVDDMLALARADAGQHKLMVHEFYLNDLTEETCRAMQVLANRKGVALTVKLSDDVSFQGDEDLIKRLMTNLIDNGVKYTPPGGVVSVELASDPAGVQIVVSDTGIGIPAESAPFIFDRFYRVDSSRSRADGGSGLGLAIARWIVEAHNGSIDLAANPGGGSKFSVRLPK